jgi:hypothetical protein
MMIVLFGLCLVALASTTSAAQSRPDGQYFGTWKLNPEKSKNYPGGMPKEYWMIVEDRGCGFFYSTVKGVARDGKELMTQYMGRFDKKESPMLVIGSPTVGTVTNWVTGPDSSAFTTYSNGKVAGHGTRKMTPDGKTLVEQQTDAQGKPTSLLWWELDRK